MERNIQNCKIPTGKTNSKTTSATNKITPNSSIHPFFIKRKDGLSVGRIHRRIDFVVEFTDFHFHRLNLVWCGGGDRSVPPRRDISVNRCSCPQGKRLQIYLSRNFKQAKQKNSSSLTQTLEILTKTVTTNPPRRSLTSLKLPFSGQN